MSLIQTIASTTHDGNMSFAHGSVDEVVKNRERFLEKHEMSLDDCVVMHPMHENEVVVVDEAHRGYGAQNPETAIRAEAFVTATPNLPLFLLTADCLPVVLHDPVHHVVAIAHLGWKPTDKQLLVNVIKVFKENYESHPNELQIYIGPGIHKESYVHVNPEKHYISDWGSFLEKTEHGTHIDLVGYNIHQLMQTGVPLANIETSSINTASSAEYFSHYRAIRTNEPEGRFATVVTLI